MKFLMWLLSNETLMKFFGDIILELIGKLIHKRATDSSFKVASDSLFARMAEAKTPADRKALQEELRKLMAG